MFEALNNIDTQLFLIFNGIHSPYMDNFMKLFTMKFVWVPMYATIILIIFRRYNRQMAILFIISIILSIALADQICATLIRPVVERMRPANPDNPLSALVHIVGGYRGGRYGFPSCHGANSFALATIMILIIRQRRFSIFILIWASVNSYSRLYLGVHYPGDLFVGAIIGSICAFICYFIAITIGQHIYYNYIGPKKSLINIPIFRMSGLHSYRFTVPASDLMLIVGITTTIIIAAASLITLQRF